VNRAARFVFLLLVAGGCGVTDAPPPDPDKYINIQIVSGAEQVGLPGSQLSEPIAVRLRSTVTGDPIVAREVRFSAASETGITFSPAAAFTDASGIARTSARLGSAVGRHTVQINFADNPGLPSSFILEAALAPSISLISPAQVSADGSLVITGTNFSATPALNEVQIDGTRATITAATTTRIDARVPACLPTRTASLVVRRGSLVSAATPLNVTAAAGTAISPARGQAIALSDRSTVGCVRIGAQPAGAEYLVVLQHTANSGATQVPLRIVGLRDGSTTSTSPAPRPVAFEAAMPATAIENFTQTMREREAAILRRMGTRARTTDAAVVASVPVVGETRPFKVFVPRSPATTVTAKVRAVGATFAIYEDVEAAGSVPQANIDSMLVVLEGVIYATDLAVFGAASDIDHNQRIIVLLTPGVNRLTSAGETSFISGYFDPCDMVEQTECSDTNRSEILYFMVPDPTGRWGLVHPVQRIVDLFPPLAAHELAHLIHFNQRVLVSGIRSLEELWLSEALAHFAEDTVASVLRSRGLTTLADQFARQNYIRAYNFLTAPEKTSLIASTGQATIEERGAGWLFLKYLNNRFPASNLVRRLESSPVTGASSVTAVTGAAWNALMRDWAIALFAAGSPDLAGVTLASQYSFGAFDMRGVIAGVSAQGFPLKPGNVGAGDFSVDWPLAPSATSFTRLTVAAGAGVNLIVAGERGGEFATAAQPQITIFRIR
jgi:hypothetical protein